MQAGGRTLVTNSGPQGHGKGTPGQKAWATTVLVALIFALGVAGSVVVSDGVRTKAQTDWDAGVEKDARRLTGALFQWIEASMTPLHALAALLVNSDRGFDPQLDDAVDLLKENTLDLFPESLVIARRSVEGRAETWQNVHVIGTGGVLKVGDPLGSNPALEQSMAAALARPGETVIGAAFRDERGTAWLVPAVAVNSPASRYVVLALIDLTWMVEGRLKSQTPDGLAARLFFRPPGTGPDRTEQLLGQVDTTPGIIATRALSEEAGGAAFDILWDATGAYQGGRRSALADTVLGGGIGATALLSLFIHFLLKRNERTNRLVQQRTTELTQKEAQLRLALENMPGGMLLADKDLGIRLVNTGFSRLLGLSDDALKSGMTLEDLIRHMAGQGYFGAMDDATDDRISKRVATLRQETEQTFYDQTPDGRTLLVRQRPTEDGGLVIAHTDITEQKRVEEDLNHASRLINESLKYARRIQRALLPPLSVMETLFEDHTILWEPKDMVGGDMAWLRETRSGLYLIVADCTGHGAPGAFMTLICTGALDQSLAEMDAPDPADVLRRMNVKIRTALGQDGDEGESDDGVELGICHIDTAAREITFAGARFSLAVVQDNALEEIKGDRSAIGYRRIPTDTVFSNNTTAIEPGMQFYMWTDGMVDQVGGPKRRSFGKRRIKETILQNSGMEMERQIIRLLVAFEDYQHTEPRRDDVTFVGFVPRVDGE